MKDEKLDTLLNELQKWSKSLALTTEEVPDYIKKALYENEPLPDTCPSRASLAELELRAIKKKLNEVNGIYQMIHDHLFEHYKDKH